MDDLKIHICSDLDYEGMVVDIRNEEGRIATLSCDKGIDEAQMIIFNAENDDPVWIFDFASFREIMDRAFVKLKESNFEK